MNAAEETSRSELARIWKALDHVTDPEIPVISVVEMGIIADVVAVNGRISISMTPTFAGCPALDVMRENITHAVRAAGFDDVKVNVVFDPPWSSDRISEEGRRKLKEYGLAPPARNCSGVNLTEAALSRVTCPYCNSLQTTLESIFGPTLCRAIHYCNACQQSFEQFKPI